jgi:hypothetical protein
MYKLLTIHGGYFLVNDFPAYLGMPYSGKVAVTFSYAIEGDFRKPYPEHKFDYVPLSY